MGYSFHLRDFQTACCQQSSLEGSTKPLLSIQYDIVFIFDYVFSRVPYMYRTSFWFVVFVPPHFLVKSASWESGRVKLQSSKELRKRTSDEGFFCVQFGRRSWTDYCDTSARKFWHFQNWRLSELFHAHGCTNTYSTCSNVRLYASRHTSNFHMHTSTHVYVYSRITHIHSFKDTNIQLFLFSHSMIYGIFLHNIYDLFT